MFLLNLGDVGRLESKSKDLQYKMFLLNASINLESHLFYRFTIQNVSIKYQYNLHHLHPQLHLQYKMFLLNTNKEIPPLLFLLFTIQNVSIKL